MPAKTGLDALLCPEDSIALVYVYDRAARDPSRRLVDGRSRSFNPLGKHGDARRPAPCCLTGIAPKTLTSSSRESCPSYPSCCQNWGR